MLAQSAATDTPWWAGVLVLAGLGAVIASLVANSRAKVVAPERRDTWKDHVERALAALRRAYDDGTEDAALAPADRHEGFTSAMSAARDHLYRLEATAPDGRVRAVAVECNEAAQEVEAAFAARGEARLSYESADPDDKDSLRTAREREVRASESLSGARLRLDKAIASLSRLG